MVARLSALVKNEVGGYVRASAKAIIEIDSGARCVEHDVIFDVDQARFVVTPEA